MSSNQINVEENLEYIKSWNPIVSSVEDFVTRLRLMMWPDSDGCCDVVETPAGETVITFKEFNNENNVALLDAVRNNFYLKNYLTSSKPGSLILYYG